MSKRASIFYNSIPDAYDGPGWYVWFGGGYQRICGPYEQEEAQIILDEYLEMVAQTSDRPRGGA
jgi:hypothetical protein